MIPHEEALKIIDESTPILGTETVPTHQSAGRVLAEEVAAKIPSPPFNKSAMDGFAVRAADVGAPPVEMCLVGESFAGRWPDFRVGPGQCARITTGAPVPEGADMVVMVEHTSMPAETIVRVEKLSGENICIRGEDVAEGQIVLKPGETVTAIAAGVAAGAGFDQLRVYRKPSCAVVCTGTEVTEPGQKVGPGQIYNANGPMLTALLAPLTSKVDYLGIAADSPEAIEEALAAGLERDLLVISGGVSVGRYDLVPDVLAGLGAETLFHKVATKPGKPVLFARRGETVCFGLPGNPLSCFVVFHIMMRAAIAKMTGSPERPPEYRTGYMTHALSNKPGRKTFRPCTVVARDGRNAVALVPSRGSADIMGASAGDAFLVIPGDRERLEEGEMVEYFEV